MDISIFVASVAMYSNHLDLIKSSQQTTIRSSTKLMFMSYKIIIHLTVDQPHRNFFKKSPSKKIEKSLLQSMCSEDKAPKYPPSSSIMDALLLSVLPLCTDLVLLKVLVRIVVASDTPAFCIGFQCKHF